MFHATGLFFGEFIGAVFMELFHVSFVYILSCIVSIENSTLSNV